MKGKLFIPLLVFILLSGVALATGEFDFQRIFIDFNDNIIDQWNQIGTSEGEGLTYTSNVRTYNKSGSGAPKAVNFTHGQNNYLNTSKDSSIEFQADDDFTICHDYRLEKAPSNDYVIYGSTRTDGTYTTGYIRHKESLAGTCAGYITWEIEGTTNNNQGNFCAKGNDFSDNEWHRICMNWAGSVNSCNVWVDAVNVSITFSQGNCDLGVEDLNKGSTNGRWFIGAHDKTWLPFGLNTKSNIDNWKIYNKTLTEEEIANDYNFGNVTSPVTPDTDPPTNSTWNVTSNNIAPGGNSSIWNLDGLLPVNVTSNLVAITVIADEDSNMTCSTTEGNLTQMLAVNPNYLAATLMATNHAFVFVDNLTKGDQCGYCSFMDGNGNEPASGSSSSGCLNITLLNSCVYLGGNWTIQASDQCNITSPVDVGGNNILVNGSGILTITANITNYNDIFLKGLSSINRAIVYCNGACFGG